MRQALLLLAAAGAALLASACSREPKPQPLRTYSMGEKVTVGHMVYTVFETRWLTQIQQEPAPRVPANRFFQIRLSAVNGAGGDVIVPDMTIEDESGNSYHALTNGDGVPQWLSSVQKIAPAEAATGNVIFDVPPRHYKLRVSDENGEGAALIDIPFSLESEIPGPPPVPGSAK